MYFWKYFCNDDYLSTFYYLLSIITSIPFISKKEDDLKTLYFDLCQIKEFMMSELINNRSRGEISETRHLIKNAYITNLIQIALKAVILC